LVVIVGALSSIVGMLAFTNHSIHDHFNRPSEARRIAEAATVTGFVRTAVVDMDDGDNPPYAEAYFIGPAPKPDPLAVVSVPTIQLTADAPPSADYARRNPDVDSAVAGGKRPDGCAADMVFVSNPTSTVYGMGGRDHSILTNEQLAAVHNHTAVVIELGVNNCGW
jgi:hypothetical protein